MSLKKYLNTETWPVLSHGHLFFNYSLVAILSFYSAFQSFISDLLLTTFFFWGSCCYFGLAVMSAWIPEMTSSSSISLRPFLKSSSIFSIWVPAFRRWELHQAVNVWHTQKERHKLSTRYKGKWTPLQTLVWKSVLFWDSLLNNESEFYFPLTKSDWNYFSLQCCWCVMQERRLLLLSRTHVYDCVSASSERVSSEPQSNRVGVQGTVAALC